MGMLEFISVNILKRKKLSIVEKQAIKDLKKLAVKLQIKEQQWTDYDIPNFDWSSIKIFKMRKIKSLMRINYDEDEKMVNDLEMINERMKMIKKNYLNLSRSGKDRCKTFINLIKRKENDKSKEYLKINLSIFKTQVENYLKEIEFYYKGLQKNYLFMARYTKLIDWLRSMKKTFPAHTNIFKRYIDIIKDAQNESRDLTEGVFSMRRFFEPILLELEEIINSIKDSL